MRFKDQVALITGAGRGIGKAIALAFAREGADIALAEIDADSARATAGEIEALGRRAFFRQVDIGDCAEAQRWVADAARELGRVDIMVNNAGVAKSEPFLEVSRENWEKHLRVHLSGAFYCSQAAAREMVRRKYGRIVSMASVAGLMGPLDLGAVWRGQIRHHRADPSDGVRAGGSWNHRQRDRPGADRHRDGARGMVEGGL